MSSKVPETDGKDHLGGLGPIRDVSDFCRKWPQLRTLVSPDGFLHPTHPEEMRQMVHWLVLLADRVCLDFE